MSRETLNISHRFARQLWGNVNSQKTICKGVTWFSCEGHAGYIVDTDIYDDLKQYNDKVYVRLNSRYYRPSEQHFAPFEEDCMWAALEYLHKDISKLAYKKFNKKYATFEEYFNKCVISTIKHCYPEILK